MRRAIYVVTLLMAALVGWLHAHATIADECKRLGSFYVGDTTYQCAALAAKDVK